MRVARQAFPLQVWLPFLSNTVTSSVKVITKEGYIATASRLQASGLIIDVSQGLPEKTSSHCADNEALRPNKAAHRRIKYLIIGYIRSNGSQIKLIELACPLMCLLGNRLPLYRKFFSGIYQIERIIKGFVKVHNFYSNGSFLLQDY